MTKLTYDLVNVYYKGQESLKKQDNSYFMCLYTMLVVLFILVVALLISSIHTFEPVKKEGNIGKMPEDIKKLQTPEDVVHKQVSKVPEFHIDDVDVSENYDLVLPWKNFVDFFIGEEETTKSESHTIDPSVEVITEFQSFFKGDKGEEEPLLKREKYIVSTGIEIAEDKISNEDVDWYSMDKGLQIIQNLSESFDSKQSTYKGEGTCNTSRCEMTATRMISSINLSTEPCGNFYNFACGGVSRRDKEEIDIFDSLSEPDVPNFLRKFKEFYMSCVNHEDLFDYPKRFEMTKEVLKMLDCWEIH
ncbi:hypothetical protein HHI36_020132 [Cryptolaemus montrouzieri]|uniref:Neprilysin n=1 Tax=Cryptolaemus montrouzieri TaxID=559131 RepID=A0ABD2NA42_9CUCU